MNGLNRQRNEDTNVGLDYGGFILDISRTNVVYSSKMGPGVSLSIQDVD